MITKRQGIDARVKELSYQRYKEFADELPWYYNIDSLSSIQRADYIKNNLIFKNKVIHYLNSQLTENVFHAIVIRNLSLELLWNLEQSDNPTDATSLKEFLTKRGLKPFAEYPCNQTQKITSDFLGFRNSVIVYNSTSNPIMLKFMDNKDLKNSGEIKPGKFMELVVKDNQYIQVGNNCEKVYMPVRNGYLIIE